MSGPTVHEDVPADLFRAAMSRWASGVSIFTARGPEGPVGVTVSSFSSVSLDPPLVLGCIAHSTSAHEALCAADGFGVHILGHDQKDLSGRFAGPPETRFDGVPVEDGPFGEPLLPLGLVRLSCAAQNRVDCGDHTILVGRVVDAVVADGDPLVYFSRAYRGIVDHA